MSVCVCARMAGTMLAAGTIRLTLVGPQVASYGSALRRRLDVVGCGSDRTDSIDKIAHPLSWMTICVIHSWHFPKHTSQYAFCKLHAAHATATLWYSRGGGSECHSALSLRHTQALDASGSVGPLLVDACM